MRKKCLLCLAAWLPVLLFGKGEIVYTDMQSLYSNTGAMAINKVVLSDTITVLYCTVTGKVNSWFRIAPMVYLSDEKTVHHPVKGAVGVTLGDRCYIPKTGQTEFRLLFEPMPKETRIFDLIEGTDNGMYRIYGIHAAKAKVNIPVAKEEIDAEETAEAAFCKGKAVMRGRITDYSRNWNHNTLTFDTGGFEQALIQPYEMALPWAAICPDGTFEVELSLDHPVWGTISSGRPIGKIPFYARPGDTLDITVKGWLDSNLSVEYAGSNPKGCCKNLMACQNVPAIYYGWNRLTDYGRNLDGAHYVKMVGESVAESMRLCDYMAWKYKLSPWEARLLKNRHRMELVDSYLFIANRLFQEKVVSPNRPDTRKENFEDYDFTPFKLLSILPLDDPSLSFLPHSVGYPTSIDTAWPMSMINMYVFDANRPENGPVDLAEMGTEKTRLRMERFRELGDVKDTPWALQAFLTEKAGRLPDNLTPEERGQVLDYLSSCVTHPYFKEKIKALDRLAKSSASWTYELPEGKGRKDMKRILENYKGKNVQVIWLSSPYNDMSFCVHPSVQNLTEDFSDSSDLNIIAIVNGDAYSASEMELLRNRLSCAVIHVFEGEAYLDLMGLLHISGSGKQSTFDRNGLVFKQTLDLTQETPFRQRLKRILKAERNMN